MEGERQGQGRQGRSLTEEEGSDPREGRKGVGEGRGPLGTEIWFLPPERAS